MPSLRTKITQAWSKLGRRLGTRQRTMEIFKTLIVVIPLTLLIWIYAERAQKTEEKNVKLTFGASLSDPNFEATIIEPVDATLQLDLEGSRVAIDALKTELERRSMDHKLTLPLPVAFAHEGSQNAEVAQILNSDSLFRDAGVFITDAKPALVRVSVAKIVPRDVTVVVPPDAPVTLQDVSFDPPHVNIRGAESLMNTTFPVNNPTIAIDLSNLAASLTGVGPRTVDVPLAMADPRLKATPDHVKMSFTISSTERDATIRNVPIVVQKPLLMDKNSVTVTAPGPLIQNVVIHGPNSLVQKYEGDNPALRPSAVLKIEANDAGKSDQQRAVKFIDLPPEVKVIGSYPVDFSVSASDQ